MILNVHKFPIKI